MLGKEAGATYTLGSRIGIANDRAIIGDYGVNAEGSGDMYYKGGNMLHMIRQIVDDDEKWRGILRGLNQTFRHQTVTGRQVQEYINAQSGINFDKVFEQYLQTAQIPVFEYRIDKDTLTYRWTSAVRGFDMPIKVTLKTGEMTLIKPKAAWQKLPVQLANPSEFRVDQNFYVGVVKDPPY
jgi:hypothetical protein